MSKKSNFKQLIVIWNLHFSIISIQNLKLERPISLLILIFLYTLFVWECLEYIVGEVTWHGRWTPKRWDLGSGWHFVWWLDGWPFEGDWLVDWSSEKCHLCIDVKDRHPLKIWIRINLAFCQIAGWLPNCSWLAGHLTKCQLCIDIKDGHPLKIRIRVRLTFCQMACWLANWSWLAEWQSNNMLTWLSPRVWIWVRLTFCQMACWLAGWLVFWQNTTCVLM